MKIIAVCLFLIGVALRYMIKKRRFNRTSFNGFQSFNSYEGAWVIQLAERLGFWLGTLMAIAGLIVLFVMW